MTVQDLKNKINQLEEKYWQESLSDMYDSDFMMKMQEEIKVYKTRLKKIELSNELAELMYQDSYIMEDRVIDCIKNFNPILEDEEVL